MALESSNGRDTAPKVSDDRMKQALRAKMINSLRDHKANRETEVVVVGDTSSGKSTTINYILGYTFNYISSQIATRRPCIITMMPGETSGVNFKCAFKKWDREECITTDLREVHNYLKEVNSQKEHPEWFPSAREVEAFDHEPVYVELTSHSFDRVLRLIDLPGLIRTNNRPMDIAKKFLQSNTVAILVVGTEHAANGGFPDLAEVMKECKQVLVVQNYANHQCRISGASNNFQAVSDKLGNKDFKFICVDFGLPYGDENSKEGRDEPNYQADQASMQQRMAAHDRCCAEEARVEFSRLNPDWRFGLEDLLRLIESNNDGVDESLRRLFVDVKEAHEQAKHRHEVSATELRRLENPPEWTKLLSEIAQHFQWFCDGTFSVKRADVSFGWTTLEEQQELAKLEPEEEKLKYWIDKSWDEGLFKELELMGLATSVKLRGRPAWQRLLSEFLGVLVYFPMPIIEMNIISNQLQAPVGQGSSGRANVDDRFCDVICGLGQDDAFPTIPFIDPLDRLQKRLNLL